MASSINYSGISKYVDQNAIDLIREYVREGRTLQTGVRVQTDVKYIDTLNILTSQMVWQAGGCGAISPTGSVFLTQRQIQTTPFKVEETICITPEFEQYWLGKKGAKAGSYNETTPKEFAVQYSANKVEKLQADIDDAIWGNAQSKGLALGMNGFIQILGTANSGVILGSTASGFACAGATATSGSGLTAGNIYNVMESLIFQIPADVIAEKDMTAYVGYDTFRTYAASIRAQKFYFYDGAEDNDGLDFSTYHPGTNVKVVAVSGLNNFNGATCNHIVITPASNLYVGVDLENDYEQFAIWFERYINSLVFRAQWKLGVQVAFPNMVVYF